MVKENFGMEGMNAIIDSYVRELPVYAKQGNMCQ